MHYMHGRAHGLFGVPYSAISLGGHCTNNNKTQQYSGLFVKFNLQNKSDRRIV